MHFHVCSVSDHHKCQGTQPIKAHIHIYTHICNPHIYYGQEKGIIINASKLPDCSIRSRLPYQ